MSRPVDVLAVMTEVAEVLLDERMATTAHGLEEARAAVAELILAAEETQADAQTLGMDIPRLDAAIKRVRGAA